MILTLTKYKAYTFLQVPFHPVRSILSEFGFAAVIVSVEVADKAERDDFDFDLILTWLVTYERLFHRFP